MSLLNLVLVVCFGDTVCTGYNKFLILSLSSSWTLARRSSSSSSSNLHSYNTDPNTNFIDDPKTSNIDFSQGITNPDGTVCVERQKFIDKTEKNQLKECFVQNVTQCYYTYVTEYTDGEQEKCDEFYWKSCKIVFEQKTFNATSRKCKRPLTKQCDDSASPYGAPETNVVCQTFYETMCNTTDVIPEPGDEPLAVTFCEKFPRKICAPDNCKVVEGFEQCEEETVASVFETPTELCDLQPQKHCSTVKVAVPRLIPEKKCRKTERQICNTQLVNPHSVDKTVFIKYCSRPEKRPSYQSTYLPPPPAQYPPPPPSSSSRKYSQPSAPTKQLPLPAYGPPPIRTSQPPVYSNSLRSKRGDDDDATAPIKIPVKISPTSSWRRKPLRRTGDANEEEFIEAADNAEEIIRVGRSTEENEYGEWIPVKILEY